MILCGLNFVRMGITPIVACFGRCRISPQKPASFSAKSQQIVCEQSHLESKMLSGLQLTTDFLADCIRRLPAQKVKTAMSSLSVHISCCRTSRMCLLKFGTRHMLADLKCRESIRRESISKGSPCVWHSIATRIAGATRLSTYRGLEAQLGRSPSPER